MTVRMLPAAFAVFCLCVAAFIGVSPADAQLVLQDLTAPNLIGDSNVESNAGVGPGVFSIGAQACNMGANPLRDLFTFVGDGTTPGTFPVTVAAGPDYSGSFSIALIPGESASRFEGKKQLDPGTCITFYYQVEYPVVDAMGNAVWGKSNTPADDLALDFTIWGSATDTVTNLPTSASLPDTVTVRNEITANPNKIQPNPAGFTTFSPDDGMGGPGLIGPGELITVTFNNATLGNPNQGFDADMDGNPDYDAWFQPIGESYENFGGERYWDPSVFRLVRVDATFGGSGGGCNPAVDFVTTVDDWYLDRFDTASSTGGGCSGWDGTYSYTFIALKEGVSRMSPYQEVASGSENEKYNGDYCGDAYVDVDADTLDLTTQDPICVVLRSGPATNLELTKDVDKATAAQGETLTYTLDFDNVGANPVGSADNGIELLDQIPANTTFVASSATCSLTCTILFSTDGGSSWTEVEPAAASVTDLRWVINQAVGPGTGGLAGFQVAIDNPFEGTITNVGNLRIDNGPILLTDDAVTTVGSSTLSDFVWHDLDGDGVQDGGEPGLDGVTVELLDGGGSVLATTTTAGGGLYSFTSLLAGTYAVRVTAPAGFVFTAQDQGADTTDSDVATANGTTANIALGAGETRTDVDAGLFQPAAIGDFVWSDLDNDGVQDAGEPGIDGITVELLDGGGSVVATTTTAGGGAYSFTGLAPGTYAVRVTLPAGSAVSPQDQGSDATDSDIAAGTGQTANFVVGSGQTKNDVDAGLFSPSPALGLAKRVTSVSAAGGGAVDVAYSLVVENLGNTPLTNVQVTDDLSATFPAPVTFSIQAGPTAGGTLAANGGFDGSADQNLLTAGSSSLAIGASATITFTVRITPNGATGPFSNTADASGDDPSDTTVTDVSDDGVDPDPDGDGNGDESGENDPTPVSLPAIGLAKRVTGVTAAGGGAFDVAYSLVVENLGPLALSNVQVTDDLAATFPAPVTFAIQVGPTAGGTLAANGGFDGSADQNLLTAGSSSLGIGASATITFTVRITPNGAAGPFDNTATATGEDSSGIVVSDVSDDGTDPDPDGDGNGDESGENDPTPVVLPVIGLAKQVTGVSPAPGGAVDIAYSLVVENLGPVDLVQVQVTDDLAATFPAPTSFAVQAGPTAGGTLAANAGFDGDTDQNLLVAGSSSLAVGASATITFTVRLQPADQLGPFVNSALASGQDPVHGVTTTDISDDGVDPDPDGGGDPDEAGENDPTPVSLGSLGDFVWNDLDGDGVQDPGEPGLAGVVVELRDGVCTPSVDCPTRTTDALGGYLFGGLAPGGYTATVIGGVPAGFTLTTGNDPFVTTLTAGETVDTADFGYEAPAGGQIGDFVWNDLDGDGVQDPGEPGLPGVVVELQDGTCTPSVDCPTQTTNAGGGYLFTGLTAGSYTVDVIGGTPVGSTLTTGNDPMSIVLGVDEVRLDADFGYRLPVADVVATKASDFQVAIHDNDDSGGLSPGDGLSYVVDITNQGGASALAVVFDDTPDPNTTLVAGTVVTSQGTVTTGNTAGDTSISVAIGTLAASDTVTITFEVAINDPLPEGVTQVVNQGLVTGTDVSVVTNDPDSSPDDDPTIDTIVAPPAEIPTLSEWGLIAMALLLLAIGRRFLARSI